MAGSCRLHTNQYRAAFLHSTPPPSLGDSVREVSYLALKAVVELKLPKLPLDDSPAAPSDSSSLHFVRSYLPAFSGSASEILVDTRVSRVLHVFTVFRPLARVLVLKW
jgi:hypothetical protein